MKSLLLFCSLLFLFKSYSQNCGTYKVKPKPGQYGYKERGSDERCEGLFTENVGGLSLDVLSFTCGQLHYKLYNNEVITIKTSSKAVLIRGSNYGMYDSYRLDLSLDSNSSKKIPVSDVLAPNKISDNNLGIYGYIQNENHGLFYLPMYVYSKSYRNQILDPKNFYLKLIPNTVIQNVQWRYADYENNQCNQYSSLNSLDGAFTPQKPVTIILPKDLSGKQICLDIHYKTISGDNDSKIFSLICP